MSWFNFQAQSFQKNMVNEMNFTSENLDFVAGISHEIRNPLNAIIGIAHLLQQEHSREDQRELVKTLLQSSENLLELTNNILDFSKLEAGAADCNITKVNLQDSIPRTLFGQRAIADAKKIDLSISIGPDVPHSLLVDKVKFSQILLNLVSNAIKFTEEGSVSVIISLLDRNASQVTLKIAVFDTGIGIAPEKMEIILQPFRQGGDHINLKYGGTGLGLSISERLITAMGGNLTIKSELNKGSEFSFVIDLQLPEDEEEEHPSQVDTNPEQLPEGLKVLVVDDNEINLLVARKNLDKWNLKYELARDGQEAVEKVQQEHFDLILMDLHMPKMNGFEATSTIRTMEEGRFRDLPIIALSGSTGVFRKKEIEAEGFNDFLNKPFRPQELLSKIITSTEEKTRTTYLMDYRQGIYSSKKEQESEIEAKANFE